jgi:hypothetical protein
MKSAAGIAVALSATLATSVVGAQPPAQTSERVQATRVDDWANLASPIPTRHGTESISVGRQAGAFRSLRISALSGVVHVRSIRVEFSNGRVATFYVARRLDRQHRQMFIDLNAPRFIDNIVVTTARKPAGTYAVFGARALAPGYDLIARLFR